MSGVLQPRGPLPARVYWVRRVLAVVVALLVLLALNWVWHRATGSAQPVAATTPTPTPTPTPTHSATPSSSASSATSSPTASRTSSSPSPSATVADCSDSAIGVTASTDAASYPVGSTPKLRMRIQNTSSKACRRDVGAAQNELVIRSGSTRVWSSDDCSPGGNPDVETLEPGQSYSVTVTWLGRLSAKGCPSNEPLAQAGTYKLAGRNGTVTSAPAVFALTTS